MNEIPDSARATQEALLAWYDRHARFMPWRVSPADRLRGIRPDPYHVWLSEVMLQQTQVATVRDYFNTFVRRWPDFAALARADTDEVMAAWAGLGYYSRARNLKKCAEAVVAEHGGRLPRTCAELKRLPGIGDYTAAAVAAIAFDEPVAVVDGNVERVISRLFAIAAPLPRAKAAIRKIATGLTPSQRPGDFAQAMMDLGATLCTPRRPACLHCPLRCHCAGCGGGEPENFPVRGPRREKPLRRGAAFVAISPDGSLFLRKRPDTGMLAGMSEVPTTAWSARRDGGTDSGDAPFRAAWSRCGTVRHSFTHFDLELVVWRAPVLQRRTAGHGAWVARCDLEKAALPSLMKKVIAVAIPEVR